MADDTQSATLRSNLTENRVRVIPAAAMVAEAIVEVTAAASAASVFTFFRIPSNARISALSTAAWDDMADTGSPTIDFGFKAVDGNITTNDDALNDGLSIAAASTGTRLVKTIDNIGKPAWEISGESSDPGGLVDVIGVIRDAAANLGGTMVVTLVYSVD